MSKAELKAKRYTEFPIPVDERVPEGHKLILAYTDGEAVIVPLDPCVLPNEDDHNCDWEGCSSVSHVFRCSPEQKYMLERGDSHRRCEPERKEVLIQDKPTWLCGDCSRQWDVSGREAKRTTDWYFKHLPTGLRGKDDWLYVLTVSCFADTIFDACYYSVCGGNSFDGSFHTGSTPAEALKNLWEWCVEDGHVKEKG